MYSLALAIFWFWGLGKLRNCRKRLLNELETCSKRFGELRRLPTRQNGCSGLPRELPRLSPKVTMDIGESVFGRLRGGSYPNLEETWSPKQSQTGDCVLSQNIAKPMLFLGFGSLFWFWRVNKSRNSSTRWLKELKTRSK